MGKKKPATAPVVIDEGDMKLISELERALPKQRDFDVPRDSLRYVAEEFLKWYRAQTHRTPSTGKMVVERARARDGKAALTKILGLLDMERVVQPPVVVAPLPPVKKLEPVRAPVKPPVKAPVVAPPPPPVRPLPPVRPVVSLWDDAHLTMAKDIRHTWRVYTRTCPKLHLDEGDVDILLQLLERLRAFVKEHPGKVLVPYLTTSPPFRFLTVLFREGGLNGVVFEWDNQILPSSNRKRKKRLRTTEEIELATRRLLWASQRYRAKYGHMPPRYLKALTNLFSWGLTTDSIVLPYSCRVRDNNLFGGIIWAARKAGRCVEMAGPLAGEDIDAPRP